MKYFIPLLLVASFILPLQIQAQEVVEDTQEILKAEVTEIISEVSEKIPGTDTPHTVQTIKVRILEGNSKGEIVTLENDFVELTPGKTFYLKKIVPWDGGTVLYSVFEPYRTPVLLILTVLFIVLTIIFGGKQGVRGLLSLFGSFALIGFVLLPLITQGYPPVLVSIGVSSLIIILGSYVTHGFNQTTSTAVIGMILTISCIGIFAHISIDGAQLSGFETEEATYLHFNTRGSIDLPGLLLGGILIGLLGVMYDAAIGQSISVEELHRVAPHLPRKTIYKRAIRIGREHIGALVNTLAIAYVGASLPLLLLFYTSTSESALVIANREIFSTEIVRSLVGSIGLILTVPITTLVATWMLIKEPHTTDTKTILEEEKKLEHVGHHHA